MTVFLTPDLVPFYAGTYFPPLDRHGLPSFQRLLLSMADAWENRPGDLAQTVDQVRNYLGERKLRPAPDAVLSDQILDRAAARTQASFDSVNGGFGGAPKFPQPMILEFLLRQYHRTGDTTALTVAQRTLQRMARGGMYDQVGGGFHRYSVDAVWLVPHFEKMLYDNAQLAAVYLDAYQVTGNHFYRRIVEETLDYVQREMTSPEGGFYSTQDADSEGEEGKFYVWSAEEIRKALDPLDARVVELGYGVTEAGNFEGKNILFLARDPEQVAREVGLSPDEVAQRLAAARVQLFTIRSQRVLAGSRRKGAHRLERPDDPRLREGRPGPRSRRLPRDGGAGRRVHPRNLGAERAIAPLVQGRHRQAQRLPGRLRLPRRRAARSLRGYLRDALVRGSAPADRGDGQLVLGRRRRVLRHQLRSRSADYPSARPHRQRDPFRQFGRRRGDGPPGELHRQTSPCASGRGSFSHHLPK